MKTRTLILKVVRVTHLYLGVFIAPALLFFALTGGLQTFSLHEAQKGSDYVPPRWAVVLGQLHKKQTVVVPERRGPGPGSGQGQKEAGRSGRRAVDRAAEKRMDLGQAVVSRGFLILCP